jgi:hypothetical protein
MITRIVFSLCFVCIFFFPVQTVLADDGDIPELSEYQIYRWNLALPSQRQYLARLYNVPVEYINYDFGYDGSNYNPIEHKSDTIKSDVYFFQLPGTRDWNEIILDKVNTYYVAPPELDEAQRNRWLSSQASARVYLARLYGIPEAEAEYYGARYKSASSGFGNNGNPPTCTPFNPDCKN